MASAVAAGVKREHPSYRIFILTKREDIFLNNPDVEQVYNTRWLLKNNMDIYNRSFCLNYPDYDYLRKYRDKGRHLVDYMYDALPFEVKERIYKPRIYLSEKEKRAKYRKMRSAGRPVAAVSVYGGATTKIPAKFYPLDEWQKVTGKLSEAGVTVLQLGISKEGPVLSGAVNMLNIGYRKTAAVLSHCDLLITHVSGFMHLAQATDVPCLALYGGVEDVRVSGYPEMVNFVSDVNCGPCWRRELCDEPKCLEQMGADSVFDAAMKAIGDNLFQSSQEYRDGRAFS
jgi:ADP-heptose:LPS heptosyltransferase